MDFGYKYCLLIEKMHVTLYEMWVVYAIRKEGRVENGSINNEGRLVMRKDMIDWIANILYICTRLCLLNSSSWGNYTDDFFCILGGSGVNG